MGIEVTEVVCGYCEDRHNLWYMLQNPYSFHQKMGTFVIEQNFFREPIFKRPAIIVLKLSWLEEIHYNYKTFPSWKLCSILHIWSWYIFMYNQRKLFMLGQQMHMDIKMKVKLCMCAYTYVTKFASLHTQWQGILFSMAIATNELTNYVCMYICMYLCH